ncbi:opsin-5-like [Alosa alosa]|uniref:opsin-5-like n=1 Tax=Alosa alosa TaxID=278164 RepID=UPI00201539D4|nr:opsin-5-like [Alosa alosa]
MTFGASQGIVSRTGNMLNVLEDEVLFQSTIPEAADISMAIVYAIFGMCSVLGNSMLLYVSYKKKHLLKPAEFFIINLAISDLGLTISLYPMAILSSAFHRWLFGRTACLIYAFCGLLFGICSLTTLTLLSLVCFMKVCYPLYGNRFQPSHGRLLVACAWLYSLGFAGCPLVHWGEYGPEPYGTACCIDLRLSNLQPGARSYMLVLFVGCYLLPCAVMVVSYTSILVTVRTTKKAMERHVPKKTRMGNIQAIIVKLSVAVCIGFLSAWSPYAVVSMWAAFGHLESIPQLAFAVPAMFAKSSTIYNPLVYMLLRPSFRRVVCRDLGVLRRVCLLGCTSSSQPRGPPRPSKSPRSAMGIMPLRIKRVSPRSLEPRGRVCRCSDAYECFRNYPKACCVHLNPKAALVQCPSQEKVTPVTSDLEIQTKRLPANRVVTRQRTEDIDYLQFNLETVPGHVKVAWP